MHAKIIRIFFSSRVSGLERRKNYTKKKKKVNNFMHAPLVTFYQPNTMFSNFAVDDAGEKILAQMKIHRPSMNIKLWETYSPGNVCFVKKLALLQLVSIGVFGFFVSIFSKHPIAISGLRSVNSTLPRQSFNSQYFKNSGKNFNGVL